MGEEREVSDELQCWFGLSYASWLTIPRVLMEAMPFEWQEQMAELLNQYYETFPNQPDIGTRVQVTRDGKLIKTPAWLLNYRRPNKEAIDELRGKESVPTKTCADCGWYLSATQAGIIYCEKCDLG